MAAGGMLTSVEVPLLDADFRLDRESRAQLVIAVFFCKIGKIDAHRNSLHHLHIVSGGVLRREKA